MTHEHGKRYPASDPPNLSDFPILLESPYSTAATPSSWALKQAGAALVLLANNPKATWQRIQLAPMAEPEPYKPWWAREVAVIHHPPNVFYVVACANKGSDYATAESTEAGSRADAIRIWNAMMDPNSQESERQWAREQMK